MDNQSNGPQMEFNFNDFARKFNQAKHTRSRKTWQRPTGSQRPEYSKVQAKSTIFGLIAALIIIGICFFGLLIPFNIQSTGFWFMVIAALAAFFFIRMLTVMSLSTGYEHEMAHGSISWKTMQEKSLKYLLIPALVFAVSLVISLAGSPIFHASAYSSILKVEDAVFADDLAETLNSDSIALMDTKSAKMLGDREIGSLSNVVSQYNVSDSYTQIDYNGTPKKVAALDYAGFFKWLGNKSSGIPGFVIVDPVSMSASYQQCEEGMIYVPSAYIFEDAGRYIRMHYPTAMIGNLHFEIDENGKPYYIASVYSHKIMLFNGETVSGAIILDPVTGEINKYALADVPTWADDVYDGYMICEQYNWFGTLKNGFFNKMIAKKGCNQVTTYVQEDASDDVPQADFGYVAKDGDIWIYTGITSVNGDSSNIGFLLANERTGEAHYYNISGADEKSAMAAAEGEVQEKRYQASFPSLINIDGNPTYIMVLKDASGLVKLYATVNVEQYNLVTTASTQKECIAKYRKLMGIETSDDPSSGTSAEDVILADAETDITIADIKFIDIDGNTYIYLITENSELYRAKVSTHEEMLLLSIGDQVHISYSGKDIVECTK